MLCPHCNQRGAERIHGEPPLERWRCTNCHQEYPVYQGYPIHPQAYVAMFEDIVRCPLCGHTHSEHVPEAPDMGMARVFRCPDCETFFPGLTVNPDDIGPDGLLLQSSKEYFLATHPQAMIDAVAGVERLPSFYALTQRLREYIERTEFTIVRTEDRVDMETQVREFTFFFVPDRWATEHHKRISAVQGALQFTWHAGLAQYAGTPASALQNPVPLGLALSVMINPEMVARSLQAYLNLVAGLSQVLEQLSMAESTFIESELVVAAHTQEATIRRLAAARHWTFDLTSPDQWTALILAMPQLHSLMTNVWELLTQDDTAC